MYQVSNLTAPVTASFLDGYMTDIPTEYQSQLGGTALTGNCFIALTSNTSYGPSVFSFDPTQLGVTSPVPANPLVYYDYAHTTLGPWASGRQDQYVSTTDHIQGVTFPVNSRSVLFFGRHGTGISCYGVPTADPTVGTSLGPNNVTAVGSNAWLRANSPSGYNCSGDSMSAAEISAGDSCCYDPINVGNKGTTAYPYEPFVWAYDVGNPDGSSTTGNSTSNNTLTAVKLGVQNPWGITPYAGWSLDSNLSVFNTNTAIWGAAYDPVQQRIYVAQQSGDNPGSYPLIHVFGVNLTITKIPAVRSGGVPLQRTGGVPVIR